MRRQGDKERKQQVLVYLFLAYLSTCLLVYFISLPPPLVVSSVQP